MATMNLRISGSKTKKIAVKLTPQAAFPSHCGDFLEHQKSGLDQKLFTDNMGANLFEMIFQSKPAEEILQEIKELTKKDWPQCLDRDEYIATCKLLLCLYLLSDYQSHVKNAILRVLENNREQLIGLDEMHSIVRLYLQSARQKTENATFAAGTIIHLNKSAVFAEKILLNSWIDEFQFFCSAIQSLRQKFESFSTLSAVEQQVLFTSFHSSSQAIGAVLQLANKKSSGNLGADETMGQLFHELVSILSEPPSQLPSDTLNSCAMAAVLTYDRIKEKCIATERLSGVVAVILSNENATSSDWSRLKNCSSPVKFSLSAAFLGVYKVEDMACAKFNGKYLLEDIFTFLAFETGRSSESSAILSGCRSIASLGRVLPQATLICPELLESLVAPATEHCVVHLEHHMDSVRHATKAFLTSLLSACRTMEHCSNTVAKSFKALPLDSKAKFFGVSALSAAVGTDRVLKDFSNLVEWLLESLKIPTLAPHGCSTFEVLMKNHICPDVPFEEWCSTWITPMVRMMPCPALDPVLAKVFQLRPQTLPFIVNICSNDLQIARSNESTNRLKILLSCLTMAKKYLAGTDQKWMNVIDQQQLTFALCHSEDEVKLAALALLAESRKSTEPLTSIEMTSLLTGFKYCCDTEAPSTSHLAIAILKKLLSRVLDSYRASVKSKKPCEGYTAFASYMCENAFSNLFPGSSICRRSFSLQALSQIKEILIIEEPWIEVWKTQTTKENAEILLGCLSDTYDANKKMALGLLKSFPAEVLSLNNESYLKDLLDRSISLSESHRPPDCTVAAGALSLIVSSKGAESCLRRVCKKESSSSCLIMCQILLERLEIQLEIAKKSILRASANGPMYGTLFCLRNLIYDQDLKTMSVGAESKSWKELTDKLVLMCFEMNATVAPIVNSTSPEGHLPMDFETDIELPGEVEALSVEDGDAMSKVTAQMVLLCAWRTVKEVSLTLGDLAAKAPAYEADQYLLSYDQLLQIGEHFTSLLCETKHRGAFEQAYVGFCKLCAWLWKVPNGKLPQLPSMWLDDLLANITSTGDDSVKLAKLCTTRRSAGVPFIVQALITTELEVRVKPECFHKTVATLLVLAKESGSAGQLHALNILRALFRSAHLGEHVASYVSEGFVVAITAFKSSNWAERNAATLLFSALMSRVFGVKHTPGHEDLPRKNRMTGRIFFRLYPDLFNLMSEELRSIAGSIAEGQEVAGSLYPVLLLLARLYPSSLEGTDSALNLICLLDDVSICTGSPVMHTRVLAAKALVPLVEPQQATKFILSISCERQPSNSLHGKLLQLGKLAPEVVMSDEVRSAYEKKIIEGMYLLSAQHKCPVTKGAFIDVIVEISSRCDCFRNASITASLNDLLPTILQCEDNFGFVITQQKAARLWLQLSYTSNDFSRIEQALCDVLNHPLPDVVHEACVSLLSRTERASDEIDGNSSSLLGLKPCGAQFAAQIKSSSKIANLLINRALELTPVEGQLAQFETRIALYFSCLRMSSQVLNAEWCLDGTKIHNVEEKMNTLLKFVLEQRLGPANYILLACTGELLNCWSSIPSDEFLENYSSAVLDCALDDGSPESSHVVAQILRKNKTLLFESNEKATVNSYCAAMAALQMSSPQVTEILLQLFPAMAGHTKSRAIESLAACFSRSNVKPELKLATLLLWAFGDSLFDQWSFDGSPDSQNSEQERVFEQVEVAASREEFKQSEAAAAALAMLLSEIGPDNINSTLDEKVQWIPLCCLQRPVTCREILRKAKSCLPEQQTHFMDYEHQLAVLNKMQFNEVERIGIFNYV